MRLTTPMLLLYIYFAQAGPYLITARDLIYYKLYFYNTFYKCYWFPHAVYGHIVGLSV